MITNVPLSHPAIAVLRQRVEQKLGFCVDSQQSVRELEQTLNFQLNEDTLRRIFGLRQDSYSSLRHSTLDVLVRYVDYTDWKSFVTAVQTELAPESELTPSLNQLCADELGVGEMVEISWLPDRVCRLRYLGNMRWQVVAVKNSTTLAIDDTFSCRVMAVGQEMIVDDITHFGQHYDALHIGKDHGLSNARKI